MQISSDVLAVLSGLEISGNTIKMQKLERGLYLKVDQVLQAMDGDNPIIRTPEETAILIDSRTQIKSKLYAWIPKWHGAKWDWQITAESRLRAIGTDILPLR